MFDIPTTIGMLARIKTILEQRKGATIDLKVLVVLQELFRNPVHYTDIGAIIRASAGGEGCDDGSVSASLTSLVTWKFVERVSEGTYVATTDSPSKRLS